MASYVKTLTSDLLHLFYPVGCAACGRLLQQEEHGICLICQHELPRTGFHCHRDNDVEKIFWGRVPLTLGAAFLFFKKGGHVQELLHNIKYRGAKEAAEEVGFLYGLELKEEPAFATADVIIPVPLHKSKLRKRGFNQSEYFGKGLSQGMGRPQDTEHLVRTTATATQTKKGRWQRWINVEHIFQQTKRHYFAGQHVLLVDDVVTTGSTLEACAKILLENNSDIRISIATLAKAT